MFDHYRCVINNYVNANGENMAEEYHNKENNVYGENMAEEYHSEQNYVYLNNEQGRMDFVIQHNLPSIYNQPSGHKPTTTDLHKSSSFSSY